MIKAITCKQFNDNLDSFIQGMLDFIEEGRIVNHGQTCKDCGVQPFEGKVEEARLAKAGWTDERCRTCISDLTVEEYVKDELTSEEKEKVSAHVKNCSDCEDTIAIFTEYWESLS